MLTDISGETITTANAAAQAAWDRTIEGALSHSTRTPDDLNDALAADPHFALAHAARGLMLMSLARGELIGAARQSLAHAQACAEERPVTARENAYLEALSYWIGGAPRKAAKRLDLALEEHPCDALAIKFSQVLRFMSGDQAAMLSSLERFMPAYAHAHPHCGYVMGCYAFALEENNQFAAADVAGRLAVEMAPRDIWGRHAVAHVFEMTGRPLEGEAWLGDALALADVNNLRFHIAWHIALFKLERGATKEVLALYDQAVRSEKTNDYRDISNAASLLTKLEFRGVDVGDRWEELADHSQTRMNDGQLAFAELHYVLALLGAGRCDNAEVIARRLAMDGDANDSTERCEAARQGALAAYGLIALREKRFFEAARLLERARSSLLRIGGSNAQRDLFEQAYIEALIGCGAHERAALILRDRNSARGGANLYASQRLAGIAKAAAFQPAQDANKAAFIA